MENATPHPPPPKKKQQTKTAPPKQLPPWPALSHADPDRCMVLDVPLAASHTQSVKLHEHFPTLWRIAGENARSLWFHRPPQAAAAAAGAGAAASVAATERALQSNL